MMRSAATNRLRRLLPVVLGALVLLAVLAECGTETETVAHCPPASNIYRNVDLCQSDFQPVIHAKKTPFRYWNPSGWVYST